MRRAWILAGCAGAFGLTACQPDHIHSWRLGDGGNASGEGGAPPVCVGACVRSAPIGFLGPTLIAIEAPQALPACPEWTSGLGFEGFADLSAAPHTCPACSCGPASCVLPETMHASAAKCADAEGATATSFDAPAAWEGTCSEENAIPAGLACEGAPCVQSLTIAAPTVEPCKAVEEGAAAFPVASWGKVARECRIAPLDGDGCATWGEVCAPVPPPGFGLCLYFKGDDPAFACPPDYPRREVVFASTEDGRTCSPCSCSEPEGAACAAFVAAFTDGSCGVQIGSVTVTEMDSGCFDVPPGSALGSKEAFFTTDKPGACAPSGGEPAGELAPSGPVTLCCQPGEDPPG